MKTTATYSVVWMCRRVLRRRIEEVDDDIVCVGGFCRKYPGMDEWLQVHQILLASFSLGLPLLLRVLLHLSVVIPWREILI